MVKANGRRWGGESDHTFTESLAYKVHTAIGLATTEAQPDTQNGLDATACVEASFNLVGARSPLFAMNCTLIQLLAYQRAGPSAQKGAHGGRVVRCDAARN